MAVHVLRKIQYQVSPYLGSRFEIEYISYILHIKISCYLYSSRKWRDFQSARLLLSDRNVCSGSVLASQRTQYISFTKSKHGEILPLMYVDLRVACFLFSFNFNQDRIMLNNKGNVFMT